MRKRLGPILCLAAALAGCGGGDSGGSAPPIAAPPTGGTPSPTPTACSLQSRQNWAAGVLREWYLFPETLPATFDPTGHSTVQSYVDALTATARAQNRDRFFTYVTSIAEENAFYNSGSTAGFGFRSVVDTANSRLFVAEAFENTPALNNGIDRGAEILAIGTSSSNLRTVANILSSEGTNGISAALGPATVGLSRTFRFRNAAGTEQTVTISKAEFDIAPVSARYGARIIEENGRRIGYVNLRTFISTADNQLRQAFANFRSQGITEVIVDLRYNGGGLVSTAELFSRLLAGQRSGSDVLSYTTFRPEKAANNQTDYFAPQPESIAATRIAFIGTRSSASASELVMNSFVPYLGASAALVGTNTFGKPVGQIAIDQASCDDRMRVVAFKTENRDRQGDYYNGLAGFMGATCQAGDDLSRPLGDPSEASIRAALNFLAGQSCTPISSIGTQSVRRELLQDQQAASTAQREVPGLF